MDPLLSSVIASYTAEKATSNLLPFNPAADTLSAQIAALPPSEITDSSDAALAAIQDIEIERIKFFLKEYVLTRVEKMHSNIFVPETHMSPSELVFFQGYKQLLAAQGIPLEPLSAPSSADEKAGAHDIIQRKEFVGFVCTRTLNSVRLDSEVLSLYEGDFFVAPWDEVAPYVYDGSVRLV